MAKSLFTQAVRYSSLDRWKNLFSRSEAPGRPGIFITGMEDGERAKTLRQLPEEEKQQLAVKLRNMKEGGKAQ